MYKILKIGLLALIIAIILVSGCIVINIDGKNTTSETSGSFIQTPSQTSKIQFEKLSPFEEELVGKWSRYHAYDGSYEYYIFKSDRTAFYFELIDDSRKNKKYTATGN